MNGRGHIWNHSYCDLRCRPSALVVSAWRFFFKFINWWGLKERRKNRVNNGLVSQKKNKPVRPVFLSCFKHQTEKIKTYLAKAYSLSFSPPEWEVLSLGSWSRPALFLLWWWCVQSHACSGTVWIDKSEPNTSHWQWLTLISWDPCSGAVALVWDKTLCFKHERQLNKTLTLNFRD